MSAATRLPKDRDFVETVEGLIFCVAGYLHPPDRFTAYLKYTPASVGRWARGDVAYRRELPYYHVQRVVDTLQGLAREHPRYLWHDPARDLSFSFVPVSAVRAYYRPEERLAALAQRPADPLERDAADLVARLSRASGVPVARFGITGSILLGLHDPAFSDVDLVVYGRSNALRVKAAVGALRQDGTLDEVDAERRERWRRETAERFGLGPDDVRHLEARRWNYFLYRDRYVSVHPTRLDQEIAERYGEHRYRGMGPVTVEATLGDTGEALFLPATYGLAEARVQDGPPRPITELLSHEGLFCDFGEPGDRIVARGALEARDGVPCRVVLGTAALPDGGVVRLAARRRAS